MADSSDRPGRVVDGPSGADDGPSALKNRTLKAMSFSTHVVSLNAMALMHLGEVEGLSSTERDLEAAGHVVDTLAMLKLKTQGNLTLEEDKLLDSVLYDLRMTFLRHTGGS